MQYTERAEPKDSAMSHDGWRRLQVSASTISKENLAVDKGFYYTL